MVRYTIDDREGDAISGDAYRLQMSYIFLGQGYTVASNLAFGGATQDARNPIFGRKTDSDRFAIDTTLFYRLPTEQRALASRRERAVGRRGLRRGFPRFGSHVREPRPAVPLRRALTAARAFPLHFLRVGTASKARTHCEST